MLQLTLSLHHIKCSLIYKTEAKPSVCVCVRVCVQLLPIPGATNCWNVLLHCDDDDIMLLW